MHRTILFLTAFACLAPACPPPAPVPPEPDVVVTDAAPAPAPSHDAGPEAGLDASGRDAGPPDACTRACASLRALGCPEADDIFACLDACRVGRGVLFADKVVTCWASATTAPGVRACGSMRCAR